MAQKEDHPLDKYLSQYSSKTKFLISLLVGLVLIIFSVALLVPFKDILLSNLYPKGKSYATGTIYRPAPTISDIKCANSGQVEATLYWGSRSPAVTYADISSSPSFNPLYNKNVSGTASTIAPSGFVNGSTPLTLTQGTTYYARVFDGTPNVTSEILTFTAPRCNSGQHPTYRLPPALTSKSCVNGHPQVTLSWGDRDPDVTWADIWSSGGPIYNKNVTGQTSTTAPTDFKLMNGSTSLTFTQGGTYYARVFDETASVVSETLTFTVPNCSSGNPASFLPPPVGTNLTCYNGQAQVTLDWGSRSPAVTYVDIIDPAYPNNWYYKEAQGASTISPGGFAKHPLSTNPDAPSLINFTAGRTYRARAWNGTTTSQEYSFTVPNCSAGLNTSQIGNVVYSDPAGAFTVTKVAKIFGSSNNPAIFPSPVPSGAPPHRPEPSSVVVQNDYFKKIRGTDLGPMTLYKGKLYFLLGDTYGGGNQFILPYSTDLILQDGIGIAGYQGCATEDCTDTNAIRLQDAAGNTIRYAIPNALFTIRWNGQEYMFAHYFKPSSMGMFKASINSAGIAKYDDNLQAFVEYKPTIYKWDASAANPYPDFGMASFWVDYPNNRLYMVGAPPARLGGVKHAYISLGSFINSSNTDGWTYTGDWMINAKNSNWQNSSDSCADMTVGEFSTVYNPYLGKYVLLTGRPCPAPDGGVYLYTTPALSTPWSPDFPLSTNKVSGMKLLPSSQEGNINWALYGTYTSEAMLRENGRIMYFVASNWDTYGVYLYKVEFTSPNLTFPTPTYTYSWQTDPSWGECSKSCGGGTQRRDVWCQRDQDRTRVADSFCPAATKPADRQDCNTQACPTPRPQPTPPPSITQTINLQKGWNLIGLTVNKSDYKAGDLITDLNNGGQVTSALYRWNQGGWDSATLYPGGVLNNFDILPGIGYFVKSSTNSSKTISGVQAVISSFTFNPGWNLISLPQVSSSINTASKLSSELQRQGFNVTQISRWTNGRWVSYIPSFPVSNFDIVAREGYFVNLTAWPSGRTFILPASSSSSVQALPNQSSLPCTTHTTDIDKDSKITNNDLTRFGMCNNKRLTDKDIKGNLCKASDTNGDSRIDKADYECIKNNLGKSYQLIKNTKSSQALPALPTSAPVCNSCSADINKDKNVNISDFSLWGYCRARGIKSNPLCTNADIDKDNQITSKDFDCIRTNIGKRC